MKEAFKVSLQAIFLIIFLVIGIFLGQGVLNFSKFTNTNTNQAVVAEKTIVSLMIDYGDSTIATYNDVKLGKDSTVFSLLKKITNDNNLEFSYNDKFKDLGIFIESINDVKNDVASDMWWHYWVDNQYAQIAADKLELNNGDIVEWKFIRNQFSMTER